MSEPETGQQPLPLDFGLKTWGEPLETADSRIEDRAPAVTAPRFEGVAQPSSAALFEETVAAALTGLRVIDSSAGPIAAAFRDGDESASAQLVDFLEALRTLTVLTRGLADAAGVELESIDDGSGSSVLATVGAALEQLLIAQQHEDWNSTADALEYAVVPALRTWRRLFAVGLRYAA